MRFVNAKTLLSAQNGMNVYRGCTHGCIYCDAQSNCYRMGHDFTDVEVKQNAPELLRAALTKKRKKCMIGTGSMSDPYMHCEEKLLLTRRCIEIIEEFGFGLAIQTKSDRILRDAEILQSVNDKAKCVVQTTLTTFNDDLTKLIEPNVCSTNTRYKMLKQMQQRKIPAVVWISPILPFINDTEKNLKGLLNYCFDAGVKGIICFGFGTTMRDGSREPFYAALDKHFPQLKQRYISAFGYAYNCVSPNHDKLMRTLYEQCDKYGVMRDVSKIFAYMREFPERNKQVSLFDSN
ncbi:MAG: radical SAM protein [Clostridiales bacterium]|nr:radical SAM protein [Clostridiales bacterium]